MAKKEKIDRRPLPIMFSEEEHKMLKELSVKTERAMAQEVRFLVKREHAELCGDK